MVSVFYLYVLIIFDNNQPVNKCPANQTTYPLFSGIWNLITFSLGPSLIMLIFGSLTVRHIRQSVKNVTLLTIQVQNQLRRQKTADGQLSRMMIVQCLYSLY